MFILKKKYKAILLIMIWAVTFICLYKAGLLTTDMDKTRNIITGDPAVSMITFVVISTLRVIFFIPQTVFIFIGSMLFGPYSGFMLSFVSLILSQSIMYVVGRYFNSSILSDNFMQKNGYLIDTLKEYSYKILALGIVCPVTPSDLITASAGLIKLNYKKCILVTAIADAPMIFLYGFLGTGFKDSNFLKVLSLILIVFISYYAFLIWNKIIAGHKAKAVS